MINERRELIEALTDHEGTLIQLWSLIEAFRLQIRSPDYLITPLIQKSEIEMSLMRIRDKKRELLKTEDF